MGERIKRRSHYSQLPAPGCKALPDTRLPEAGTGFPAKPPAPGAASRPGLSRLPPLYSQTGRGQTSPPPSRTLRQPADPDAPAPRPAAHRLPRPPPARPATTPPGHGLSPRAGLSVSPGRARAPPPGSSAASLGSREGQRLGFSLAPVQYPPACERLAGPQHSPPHTHSRPGACPPLVNPMPCQAPELYGPCPL